MTEPAPRIRLLVADDSAFMRQRLREVLEGGGYAVVAEAEDGAAALEQYELHRPDVVTLDLVMPRMSGIPALTGLRSRYPEARVIICSSVTDRQSIFEAIRLGARDYVLKPIEPERILDAVAKALKG